MKQSIIDTEYKPFATGSTITEDVQGMAVADIVQAYVTLKELIEGLPKARLGELREYLMKHTETFGEPTKNGGQRLSVDGSTVTRERRVSKSIGLDDALNLASDHGLQPTDVCDEVTTKSLIVNPSKIDFLVQTGKLAVEDVAKLASVTWALKVVGSEELTGALHEAAGLPLNESLPKPPKKAGK